MASQDDGYGSILIRCERSLIVHDELFLSVRPLPRLKNNASVHRGQCEVLFMGAGGAGNSACYF